VFIKFWQGKSLRITLGRAGALRLDAARLAAQKLHGELALGVDITAKQTAAVKPDTMQQAFERLMASKPRRRTTTIDYGGLWRMHTPAALKRKPVKDVTAAGLENAKQAIGAQHRTANKVIALLSAIMMKAGRFADNPAREVIKHQEHPRTRRLSMDELTRVWQAIDNEKEWADFFKVLILTGARRTPFCAMRYRDLDLDNGVWLVPVI
jgi:integrase